MQENNFNIALAHYVNDPINLEKAVEYFEKSVKDERCDLAALFLSDIYKDELQCEEKELFWKEEYLKLLSNFEKGEHYLEEDNIDEAIKYFELCNEDSKALHKLGVIYDVKNDRRVALEYFEKAAQMDHLSSIFACAIIHHENSDYKQAFQYAELASHRNHTGALFMLGIYYQNGYAVERNIEKAYHYYLRSKEQGNYDALPLLDEGLEMFSEIEYHDQQKNIDSYISNEGNDVNADNELVNIYNSTDSELIFQTGLSYFYGFPVENIIKALYYFDRASALGHAEASYYAGYLYDEGLIDQESDVLKALPYFQKAYELGYVRANYYLGDYHEYGYGFGKINAELSFKHYCDAALAGFILTYHLVGDAYKYGFGTEENLENAKFWYIEGAKQNDPRCIQALKQMFTSANDDDEDFMLIKSLIENSQNLDSEIYYVS